MSSSTKFHVTEEHLKYCVTANQSRIVQMRLDGMTVTAIAEQLGNQATNVTKSIKSVVQRAAENGYSPEIGLNWPMPPGQKLKGFTDLVSYDQNGQPTLRHRHIMGRAATDETKEEQLRAFVEGLQGEITPLRPRKAKGRNKYHKNLMPAIFIGDAHIGMRAFGVETKHHDFDTKIATEQLKEAFHYLTERAEPAENSLFVNVGDLIHANTQHGQTYSGTPLDVDTRHYAVMKAAAECMAYGIDLQLQKHKNVTVVMARGNHDTDAAGAIQLILEFYYRNEPRVNVLPTHGFFHYVEWGNWLLGIHHGDKQKPEKLGTTMARDMAEAWGRCRFRMWCTGHFHKDAVKSLDGVKHKVFAALPPPDSWHASHGFAGDGEMEMVTFKKSGGIHSTHVFNVPQPQVEPDVRIG